MKQWTMMMLAVLAASGFAAPAGKTDAMLDGNMDFRKIVQHAKDKVFPAVAYIKCLREDNSTGKKITTEVLGSGVIITPGGEVLTNWHVIDKAVEVRCLLSNGTYYTAKIKGSDKDTDLALLQLQVPKGKTVTFPYAELGDSTKLKEGSFVMAMGAPYGLNRSVSIGIVSCISRYLPGSSEYSLWLQTDALINPGNSGGPMVDTEGKVVGINTRGGEGMGFASPMHNDKYIIEQIRKHGKVNWSWTGLQLQPLKNFNKNIYFEGKQGVIVAETEPDSPARRAGVLKQDRILAINGEPITAMFQEGVPAVQRKIGQLPKGKVAIFKIRRNGSVLDIKLTPRAKGKVEGEELDCPRWNMTCKSINQFENKDLYFFKKKGVFVFGVKYPGNAASSGVSEKDILVKIDNTPVTTLKDVKAIYKKLVKNVETKHRVKLTVLRNGQFRQVVLNFQRDYDKE